MNNRIFKQFLVIMIIVISVVILLLVFKTTLINGTGFFSVITNNVDVIHEGKTLWDWLDLLLIPIALAIFAYFSSKEIKKIELMVSIERTRDISLQSYIEKVTDYLSQGSLKIMDTSKNEINNEVEDNLTHNDAQQQAKAIEIRRLVTLLTKTTLKMLDGERKGLVIQFLYDAKLITISNIENKPIISLKGADLSTIDFSSELVRISNKLKKDFQHEEFHDIDLSETNLSRANFYGVHFHNSNFNFANCVNANFQNAFIKSSSFLNAILDKADFSNSAFIDSKFVEIMDPPYSPDGPFICAASLEKTKLVNTSFYHSIVLPEQLYSGKVRRKVTIPSGLFLSRKSIFRYIMEKKEEYHWHQLKVTCFCGVQIEPEISEFEKNDITTKQWINGDYRIFGYWMAIDTHLQQKHPIAYKLLGMGNIFEAIGRRIKYGPPGGRG